MADPFTAYLVEAGIIAAADRVADAVNGNGAKPAEEPPAPKGPQEVIIVGTPPIKGNPVRVFEYQQQNALSDTRVDVDKYNALHIDVIVTGTSPSATISVEGSSAGGSNYTQLPDPNAAKVAVTANTSFDVVCGAGFATARIADISGTFAAGQGFTVIITPFVIAGSARLEAGGRLLPVDANFTRPNDTTQYAANEAVADSTSSPTVITFSDCARVKGGSGAILGAKLFDSANQTTKGSYELWLYDTEPAAQNDNAAFAPTDAENRSLVCIIPFDTVYVGDATAGAGGNCVYPRSSLNYGFKCASGSTDLYGKLVVRNAYTPVAQERFDFRLDISQD